MSKKFKILKFIKRLIMLNNIKSNGLNIIILYSN